jgi:hypothetical protein
MEENTGIKIVAVIALVAVLGFFWNQINTWFKDQITMQTNLGLFGIFALIGVFAYLGVRKRLEEH